MKKISNKFAFTLVELLVVMLILVIISLIWIYFWNWYREKTYNTKVKTDLITTDNTLRTYYQELKSMPEPDWNIKYYKSDWSYAHDEKEAYWLNWFFTEKTMAKRYISITPLDPRTKHYYAYAKLTQWWKFEVSWIISINDEYYSVVNWNYEYKDEWTYNLVKEYNWPAFVFDNSWNEFPYNPEELIITAKLNSFTWNFFVNDKAVTQTWITVKSWDILKLSAWWSALLYASDWSEVHLWNQSHETILKLSQMWYKKENNLFSDIKIALKQWTILTKAPKMWSNSAYETYTSDVEAAVRWTIYKITKIPNIRTEVEVLRWEVFVYKISETYEDLVYKLDNDLEIDKQIITPDTTWNYELIWNIEIRNIDWVDASILKESSSISLDPDTVNSDNTAQDENIDNSQSENTSQEESNDNENISCEENQHLEWEICVSNTQTWTCIWEIPQNSVTWSYTFIKTWNPQENKYLPENISWWFNQTECNLTCNDWYEYEDGWCKAIVTTITCENNYVLNTTTWQCEPKTQEVNCTWLPQNAAWNTVNIITQTWNGNNFVPTSVWTYNASPSATKCVFKCKNNYTWSQNQCKPNTITATCWWQRPNNSYPVDISTYVQTLNWTSYIPILNWKFYTLQSSPQCRYNCNIWFHYESNACIYNIQSCWWITNWVFQKVWYWTYWWPCTITCNNWYHKEWNKCYSNKKTANCDIWKKPANSKSYNKKFTQTWKNWRREPKSVSRTSNLKNDCSFYCIDGYKLSWNKCVKSKTLYKWTGCKACPFWISERRISSCFLGMWNRKERSCSRLNVVCEIEKKWSFKDINCNKFDAKSWSAYY